jgi:N-acetylglucosaminyldiphosphoundecaprenol N-acetyl-beta-D-mannosaminyltransferase
MSVRLTSFNLYNKSLRELPPGKLLISTINAHSYNIAREDALFAKALQQSNVLLPDGISIVLAHRFLTGKKIKKIAGEDLFYYEMERLQKSVQSAKCFFLGSTEETLAKIKARAAKEYPGILVETYSPAYKPEFTDEENSAMIAVVNSFEPDVLFIGMTAPKQEKWAVEKMDALSLTENGHICCIGAVFDFYAGTVNRAPRWVIKIGMEWFYRLVKEPRRMWRRYLVGNTKFVWAVVKEKVKM